MSVLCEYTTLKNNKAQEKLKNEKHSIVMQDIVEHSIQLNSNSKYFKHNLFSDKYGQLTKGFFVETDCDISSLGELKLILNLLMSF